MRQLTPPMAPMYTIQRCRKDGKRYGQVHYYESGGRTFCGREIRAGLWNTERRGYELDLANTLKGASLMRGKIRERTAYINVALEELATGTTDDDQAPLPMEG